MAQAAPIVLNGLSITDGITPVVFTFNPRSVSTALARYVADSADVMSAASPVLELGFSSATSKRNTNHVRIKFDVPIVRFRGDPAFGVKEVVGHFLLDGNKQILPDISTQYERRNFAELVKELYSNNVVMKYAKDYEPTW
jgi:hypothetical protein